MDIIDIVLAGNRGGGGGGSAAMETVLLNDYNLVEIEMLIAMGGGQKTITVEDNPAVEHFWGLITPNRPPVLLLESAFLDPGQKIYTYPSAIGCDSSGKACWLATQITLLIGSEVTTVDVVLTEVDGITAVVTVSKVEIPG